MNDPVGEMAEGAVIDQLFGPRPKKPRGLAEATLVLRRLLLSILKDIDGPATVRQLFYLVSARGGVTKDERGYRRVQRQVLLMRREGLIPYGRIADNNRRRIHNPSYNNLGHALDETAAFYRQALWRDLLIYLEVWTEKDAMVGTMFPVTDPYDVELCVARGHSSETFAWESAETMAKQSEAGKIPVVVYVGDHDPSGVHASEDLRTRLAGFMEGRVGPEGFHFRRLAVNEDQIQELNLQTRETKRTDPRLRHFEQRFGKGAESVDVDAIHPDRLRKMLADTIEAYIPDDLMAKVQAEEEAAREALEQMASNWRAA